MKTNIRLHHHYKAVIKIFFSNLVAIFYYAMKEIRTPDEAKTELGKPYKDIRATDGLRYEYFSDFWGGNKLLAIYKDNALLVYGSDSQYTQLLAYREAGYISHQEY
ncbi:MAG: hypothetical protein IH795_11790, partial [Bacteroidetes bacterium]|nr:hypothetical protein [Bacteroidota bacterium]